jgi:lysozyme
MNTSRLIEKLIDHEGLELKAYKCPAGKLTIGIGRNLEDNGISKEEAFFLCSNDVWKIYGKLLKYEWFRILNDERQEALINMAFNIGISGLLKFKKMIAALEREDFEAAAQEALNSKWATQVGYRSGELANVILKGKNES